jgi:Na+/H+ antiporter NhaC
VGYEVGIIGEAMRDTGYTSDPFSVFLLSIPYRFYLLLAVIFVAMIASFKRDFGPMFRAERRARAGKGLVAEGAEPASDLTGTTHLSPKADTPLRWINGILPIITVIIMTIVGIWHSGYEALVKAGDPVTFKTIVANASSFTALFWASLSGCTVAILLSLGQRILTLHEAMESWFAGVKSMLLAMLILLLAWSICAVTKEMGTAEYIVGVLKGTLPLWTIPPLTFAIAAFISFATGTSWGTMAILMPLVIPLSWDLGLEAGLGAVASQQALYLGVSAVLAGSIWGDHCSPISDTTVMSSMASSCDHIDHVRTQMPYAVVVGIIALALYIPAAMGVNVWLLLAAAVILLAAIVRFLGKRIA